MMQELYDMMQSKFGISEKVLQYCIQKECELKKQFQSVDEITEYNQLKVLSAMQKNKLSDIHFAATTGYGYNDLGRDVLENIYADVFQTESGLVRPQLISGTHALTVALAGNLRPGDELLSPVGIPYDTLQGVIGIRKEKGSLSEYGITYRQVDLLPGDKFDFDGIEKAINNKTKLVTIQRSKGYQWRVSFSVSQIKEVAQEAYEMFKTNTGGKNADYIPYLANIDKNLFGISICLMDGTLIQLGDSEYRFGIESVSKVHTAVLALRQYGAQKLLEMIGADATGLPFNSIMAILLEKDHPSTPLVNAGAITACSMVQPIGDSAKKWDAIVANITDLCGSAPQLIDELYKSESATNFNNRSIAWLLKNYNRIYDDPDMSLDLYTRQCSLGITAAQLSVCGATIANDGLNPISKKQIFDGSLSPKITSLIATVGFYEHTGDWLYTSGIPAKTGVGGGVMGVMPGLFGISAFAPPIDSAGNSVKAQLAIKYIMNKLGLSIFNGDRVTITE